MAYVYTCPHCGFRVVRSEPVTDVATFKVCECGEGVVETSDGAE